MSRIDDPSNIKPTDDPWGDEVSEIIGRLDDPDLLQKLVDEQQKQLKIEMKKLLSSEQNVKVEAVGREGKSSADALQEIQEVLTEGGALFLGFLCAITAFSAGILVMAVALTPGVIVSLQKAKKSKIAPDKLFETTILPLASIGGFSAFCHAHLPPDQKTHQPPHSTL